MENVSFQPIKNGDNPLKILVAYLMAEYKPEKANIISIMMKHQQYENVEINDIKWSLYFRPTSRNGNDFNLSLTKIIKRYSTLYCLNPIEIGIYCIIKSFINNDNVELKMMFHVKIPSMEGYITDESNSPTWDDNEEEWERRMKISRVLKRQTRKHKGKRRIIIKSWS